MNTEFGNKSGTFITKTNRKRNCLSNRKKEEH